MHIYIYMYTCIHVYIYIYTWLQVSAVNRGSMYLVSGKQCNTKNTLSYKENAHTNNDLIIAWHSSKD
jgi:hypothetical protein